LTSSIRNISVLCTGKSIFNVLILMWKSFILNNTHDLQVVKLVPYSCSCPVHCLLCTPCGVSRVIRGVQSINLCSRGFPQSTCTRNPLPSSLLTYRRTSGTLSSTCTVMHNRKQQLFSRYPLHHHAAVLVSSVTIQKWSESHFATSFLFQNVLIQIRLRSFFKFDNLTSVQRQELSMQAKFSNVCD